jgi:hypothetical protein
MATTTIDIAIPRTEDGDTAVADVAPVQGAHRPGRAVSI